MELLDSSVSDKHTPSYIKNQFEKHQADFLLAEDILTLARHIKIWLAIGKVENDSFLHWLQYSTLPNICILAINISKADIYLNKFLENIITIEQKAKLFKYAHFHKRLNAIKEIVEPLREYRNKRYAHLEYAQVNIATCSLEALYISLSNLCNSLDCILIWLENPNEVLDTLFHDIRDVNAETCMLEKRFKIDRAYNEFLNILNRINSL